MHLSNLIILILIQIPKFVPGAHIYIGGIFDETENFPEKFHFAIENINKQSDNFWLIPIIKRISPNKPHESLSSVCSIMSSGAIAIFGPKNIPNMYTTQLICDMKEVPHILNRWIYHPLRGSTIVNLYPHPSNLARAYMDILSTWEWKTFTILYDDNESLVRITDLLKMSQLKSILVSLKQLDQNETGLYRTTLKEIRSSGQKNLVIDCKIENLENVLLQAQQVGLMNHEFNYFITNLDMHTIDLTYFQYSEANITGIRLIDPERFYVKEISKSLFRTEDEESSWNLRIEEALLIDGVAMFANALNENEIDYKFTNRKLHCNGTDSWENGYSVINSMRTSNYLGLTGIVNFDHEGYRSDFQLDILELTEEGVEKIGIWNSTFGINITRILPEEEDNDMGSLRNKTFIVITCLTDPYGMLKETQEPLMGNDRFEGFGIDLIHELSLMEGFNYTFIIREDKSNGVKDPATGKWSGMIGDLIDHKADLAITDLTITSDREEAVDFTSPFMNLGISILFRKPGKAPPNFFSFAEPFAVETWAMLALAYVVVSIALFVMGRLCPDEWTNPYPCIEEPEFLINQFSLSNAFWFTTGSLMQQGTEIAPIAISTRMVAGMWWFFVLIMVSSYTANLAAFLTTENPIELFSDVESLVANAPVFRIRYGAKARGATYNFFKYSNINLYQKVYKHMEEHPEDLVQENKDGVNLADNEQYAFFMESTSIDYETQRHCNLTQYGKLLDNKGYGIAMRKESPYRKRLSTAILKLQSSGKVDNLKRKWWEERKGGGQCVGEGESQAATPLDLKNVEGVFFVTIGGIISSGILVLLEELISITQLTMRTGLTFKEALKSELKSYININSNVKASIPDKSKSKSKSKTKSDSTKDSESLDTENMNLNPLPYGFIPAVADERLRNRSH